MREFSNIESDITKLKSALIDKYDCEYLNSELDERVYDYVDEGDAEEYDGDFIETYTNLCMGGAIEYDILDEMEKEMKKKFPNINKELLSDIINDHFIDNCDWHDPMIFNKRLE